MSILCTKSGCHPHEPTNLATRIWGRSFRSITGQVGKGWGPGSLYAGGYSKHPHGKAFRETAPPHTPGISNVDYAASFSKFLEQRDVNKPFCFYLAAFEPHRRFSYGAGVKAGKSLKDARLPLSLPDHEVTRNDVLDYYIEIEHFENCHI